MQCDVPLRTPPCRTFSLVVLVSWTDVVHLGFLFVYTLVLASKLSPFCSSHVTISTFRPITGTEVGAHLRTRGRVGLARPGNPEMPGFFGHSFPEQLALSWQKF